MCAAAERFDLSDKRSEIVSPPAGEDEVRTGARECASEVLPQAAARSCDQRYLAG
jgi:hypothetical protein